MHGTVSSGRAGGDKSAQNEEDASGSESGGADAGAVSAGAAASSSPLYAMPFSVVWPTAAFVRALPQPHRQLAKNLSFYLRCEGGQEVPFATDENLLRHSLVRYEARNYGRLCAPHSKSWHLYDAGAAAAAAAKDPATVISIRQVRAAAVIGSANTTTSAWGGACRLDGSLSVRNWEASVLFPTVMRVTLPRGVADQVLRGTDDELCQLELGFAEMRGARALRAAIDGFQRIDGPPPGFEFAFRCPPAAYNFDEGDVPWRKEQTHHDELVPGDDDTFVDADEVARFLAGQLAAEGDEGEGGGGGGGEGGRWGFNGEAGGGGRGEGSGDAARSAPSGPSGPEDVAAQARSYDDSFLRAALRVSPDEDEELQRALELSKR
jgi:hypothetical protein